MIPWFPGGHCDPWNHVETTMALDVAGFHSGRRARLRMARRHPTRRRQLVELLPARRIRRGGQARHQRVRVHRHRCVAPLAVHMGPGLRRSPVADGAASTRLGAVDAPRGRHGDLGVHRGRAAVELRVADGIVVDRSRAALRRQPRGRSATSRGRIGSMRPTGSRCSSTITRGCSSRRIAGRWTGTTRSCRAA